MVEFFDTRIKNLEKSISPRVPPRNMKTKKKNVKKRKALTYKDIKDEDSGEEKSSTSTYHNTCEYNMDECATLKALIRQAK